MYTYNGMLLLGQKKNEIMPFATTWMDLEIVILSEVRKKKTNTVWHNSYVQSKKVNEWYEWTYIHNRNRLADIENKLVVNNGGRVGTGIN